MKSWLVLVFSFPLLLNAQQLLNKTMEHNNVMRQYSVYVPAAYTGQTSVPLVFNFHGFTMSVEDQMALADMRPIADTANFILVYPQGTLFNGSTHWKVGSWTAASTADDLGFTAAMLDTLSENFNIDGSRVYACGYSNGGYFSFELACKMSDKIAAMGSVGGTMSSETYNACQPSHPTPVISIHGTADGVVRYTGGAPANSESHATVNTFWSTYNRTATEPKVIDVPDSQPSDGSTVEQYSYTGGDSCVGVEHYKVNGGGHDWPGSTGNMDIDASKLIWEFVSKYDINGLIGCETSSLNMDDRSVLPQSFTIMPNPSNEYVVVTSAFQAPKHYQLYAFGGEMLQSGIIEHNHEMIDVSALPNGVHTLIIDGQALKLVKVNK